MPGATTTLPLVPAQGPLQGPESLRISERWSLKALERSQSGLSVDGSLSWPLSWLAALLVALPVFVQAPWVREAPVAATLFTLPLLISGVLLQQRGQGRWSALGALLVGFSGSWLGGSIFWGWFRDQPFWHLPIEAFALPLALGGWRTSWRLASGFYLGSLAGTACTDLVMALSGVIHRWPAVVNGSIEEAPRLLHEAGLSLLHPMPISLILTAALALGLICRRLQRGGQTQRIAAAALATTLAVDGLVLAAAIAAPKLSGLI
ncbi:MAG: DUF3120 domain-containing protein [Cyanobacteriota bacterium]